MYFRHGGYRSTDIPYSFLKSNGFTVHIINPIQSNSIRSLFIHQTKNDSKDSFLIAEVIRFGQFTTTSLANENFLAMRQLCRYRDSVIDCRTEIKPLSIKEAAADTFGIKIAQNAFAFQPNQLFKRLNFLNNQIEQLDAEIIKYYETFDCFLHIIPGVGIIADATVLDEIGDIRRFKNSSALVAYAGIDPSVKQSSEFNSTHNHMSKRGSLYLRHAIFLAATTCTFHDSPLHVYHKKKRDQGKHHLTAAGAVAHKLTTVIYTVLRDGKPYEPIKFV